MSRAACPKNAAFKKQGMEGRSKTQTVRKAGDEGGGGLSWKCLLKPIYFEQEVDLEGGEHLSFRHWSLWIWNRHTLLLSLMKPAIERKL